MREMCEKQFYDLSGFSFIPDICFKYFDLLHYLFYKERRVLCVKLMQKAGVYFINKKFLSGLEKYFYRLSASLYNPQGRPGKFWMDLVNVR